MKIPELYGLYFEFRAQSVFRVEGYFVTKS